MKDVLDNENNKKEETIETLLTDEYEDTPKEERKIRKRKKRVYKENKSKINKKMIIIFSSIVFVIIVAILLFVFVLVPKIELIGDKHIKVEYGEKYSDLGCKASYLGTDITDKIWYEGRVDEEKLGTYDITCKVRKNRMTVEKVRNIEVVDTKKPEITLEGETEIVICPNKEYEEVGYKAEDNYDGDLTEKVEVVKEDNKIVYKVSDSSNNSFEVSRFLKEEDNTPPVITLKGNKTVYVTVGNKFTDPGYTANDNCDEDITKNVSVSGSVDTSKEGEYTLTYKVTDSNKNDTQETRKVVVQKAYAKVGASTGCGEAGTIYLTFDDGPSSATTPTILNILKKYNVKATFFVIGSGPDNLIKREYDEGHAIGLHSSSHDYAKIYKSSEAFWSDMNSVASRVKRITGYDTKLMRFPGGASNTVSRKYNSGIMTRLANEVIEKGYNYFDWNISSGDAGGTTDPNVEYKNVVNSLSKSRGNVVLMHDIKKHTMNAIESIIKYGLDNGYKFDVLNKNINCKQRINN